MILDTSAIIATVSLEPDAGLLRGAMLTASSLAMSAVTVLETRIVLRARYGGEAVHAFETMLDRAPIAVVPFDAAQARLAFEAFQQYGKGQGHPAQLNIIDCAAYALARSRSEPLLFKGDDFSKTDVIPALRAELHPDRR